jgi:3-dehydroquinate synthase
MPGQKWLELMRLDKKAEAGEIRFVLLEAPGRAGVRAASDALVLQVIARHTQAAPNAATDTAKDAAKDAA